MALSGSTRNFGRWTEEEHRLFLQGMDRYRHHGLGRWKKIASLIKSRTAGQVRYHADRYEDAKADAARADPRADARAEFAEVLARASRETLPNPDRSAAEEAAAVLVAMNRIDGNGGGNDGDGNQAEHRESRLPPPSNENPHSGETQQKVGGGGRYGGTDSHNHSNPNTLTKWDADAIWSRVLSRRVRQLRTLDVWRLSLIEGLLGSDNPVLPLPPPPSGEEEDDVDAHVRYLENLLERHFRIANDLKLGDELRSKSLDTVKRLLSWLDEQYPPQQPTQKQPVQQRDQQQQLQKQQPGQQQQQQKHSGGERAVNEEEERGNQQRSGTGGSGSGRSMRETLNRSDAATEVAPSWPSSSTRGGEVVASVAKPPSPPSTSGGSGTSSVAGGSASRPPASAVLDPSNDEAVVSRTAPPQPPRPKDPSSAPSGCGVTDGMVGTTATTTRSPSFSPGGGRRTTAEGGPPSFVAALFTSGGKGTSYVEDAGSDGGGRGGGSATAPVHTQERSAAKKGSVRGGEGGAAAASTPAPVQANNRSKRVGGFAAVAQKRVGGGAANVGSTPSRVASISTSSASGGTRKAHVSSVGPEAMTKGDGIDAPADASAPPSKPKPPPPQTKTKLPQRVLTADFYAESPNTPHSAALTPRVACRVFHHPAPSTATPDRDLRRSFEERLDRWDPYWRRVHDVVDFHLDTTTTVKTEGGYGGKVVEIRDSGYFVTTTPVIRTDPELYSSTPGDNKPKTCLAVTFQLPQEVAAERGSNGKAMSWGSTGGGGQFGDGERRLLVRMLPLVPQGKRADTHLWPKGTFLQVNGTPVRIKQRRQQSHDPKLWKGMCEPLDLTPLLFDPTGRNSLSLLTREDATYGLQISVVEYRGPRTLLAEAVASKDVIPYDMSVELARRYVGSQTVVLDDSDDDDDAAAAGGGSSSSLTWQLTCPMAMRTMEVPARGQNCRHMQCFDLFTFLHANSFPSGRRWMCPSCDEFVSLDGAVLCGLFREMIRRQKGEVDAGADRVNFWADGTWKLAPVKKRGAAGDGAVVPGTKKRKKEPEVILL